MGEPTVNLRAPNGAEFTLHTGLFINNKFIKASSGSNITSICPSNAEEICSVEAASSSDVDRAVEAAQTAFYSDIWGALPGAERARMMNRLALLIRQHEHHLSTLETWDNGKPYTISRALDVPMLADCFEYYAGWADKIHGQTIPTRPEKLAYTLRVPLGACALIIPWNYPLALAAWKLGPALATGNTVVLKPAEQTPLSILYLANLIRQAGFPPGVVNVVNGYGREAGCRLATHPDIKKISFTGSTATGKEVMKMASTNLKNITLETGGKSPLVVFDDANLDQASKWAYVGIFSNQGQVCTSTSRILVQETVMDEFTERFVAMVKRTVVMGDPFDPNTTHGPQVSRAQYDSILGHITKAQEQGAKLMLGGGSGQAKVTNGKGFFIEPTVYSAVTKDMSAFKEEVFGPFVTITPFKTTEEAIALANNSIYGLAASVFSENVRKAHLVAAKIEAGMIWINSATDSEVRVPFGGLKQSGIGRELGEAGLDAYLETKAVHVNLHTDI